MTTYKSLLGNTYTVFRVFAKSAQSATTPYAAAVTARAWQSLPFTNSEGDIVGASLSTPQISLPAGNYLTSGAGAQHYSLFGGLRFYNVTDDETTELSMCTYYSVHPTAAAGIPISGYFELSASKVLEIQWGCSSTSGPGGFGRALNRAGVDEMYYSFTFYKIG